jgi:VRR-NUC domain
MTAVPPLLMLAAGRKPRLRRATSYQAKELELHVGVAGTLRRFVRPGWRWAHIPSGELRDKRTAAKLKAMGVQPDWPDIILVSPTGLLHALELKRVSGSLSDEQEAFADWCRAYGIPHAVARTVDQALAALDAWGCLRIRVHGAERVP